MYRLLDVKQGQNKEGKTVLYLVFEYMETDLKKYIRSFRNTGDNVPHPIIKVSKFIFPALNHFDGFYVYS